jgi:hypothetical protein
VVDGGCAAPAREKGCVDVDRCDVGQREERFFQQLTVGDDDEEIGYRVSGVGSGEWFSIDIVRLPYRNLQPLGGYFYRRRGDDAFASRGFIGLRDHEVDYECGILCKCLERRYGESGCAGKEDVERGLGHFWRIVHGSVPERDVRQGYLLYLPSVHENVQFISYNMNEHNLFTTTLSP